MGFFVYCNCICCLNSVHVLRERHEPNTANAHSQKGNDEMKLKEASVIKRHGIFCVMVLIEHHNAKVRGVAYGHFPYQTAMEAVKKATGFKKNTAPKNGETLENYIERHLQACAQSMGAKNRGVP